MNIYVKRMLKFEDIIIYGEGVVGKRTLDALSELGIESRVRYFVKSQKNFEPYMVKGVQVKSVYDVKNYYENALFLLAVSDNYISEIKNIVKLLKVKHYMLAEKFYLDSYPKSDFSLFLRKLRNDIYELSERKNYFSDMRKIHVTHVTYCLSRNAGDTVLSWCVRRFLKFNRWDIKSVREKIDEGVISKINTTDALIIGGGGLFLPDTNANSISGWQWAISNHQIEEIKVPIIIFSVGYNYFKGQTNTECFISSINCIVRKAAFVGLRNRGSVEAIKKLVADDLKNKIEYQPCITTLIRKINKAFEGKKTKQVAFNVAFDREGRRYGDNEDIILAQIAKAAVLIEQKGYSIVYVAHCDDDLRFLPYLDREQVNYKTKNLAQSLPHAVINFYQDIEVVVGMRGHAQMIPFGIGVKIISLGTHDKMKWFLEDVNLEECYVDLNTDYDTIAKRITNIFTDIEIENPEKMEIQMKKEQEILWEISERNRKRIIKTIERAKCNERLEGDSNISSSIS